MRISDGRLFYEPGTQLYSSNSFRYTTGATMINTSGNPFLSNGTPASLPFDQTVPQSTSEAFIHLGNDKVTRYGIAVTRVNAMHMLGGEVDYSVPPPPNPMNLIVQEQGQDYVTFAFASGGGSTADYVASWNYGSIAPYAADGGTVVAGSPFTVAGLTPNSQIAVRLFARNSEGELSPGATVVASTSALLFGDYNANGEVDTADYRCGGTPWGPAG